MNCKTFLNVANQVIIDMENQLPCNDFPIKFNDHDTITPNMLNNEICVYTNS